MKFQRNRTAKTEKCDTALYFWIILLITIPSTSSAHNCNDYICYHHNYHNFNDCQYLLNGETQHGQWSTWSDCFNFGSDSVVQEKIRSVIFNDNTYCWEFEDCHKCYNGGNWNKTGCLCLVRYNLMHCENRISRCEAVPADVVFVLDSSLSQTEEQFNKQLDFVARFVNAVNVSDTEFQFAVVTFSTNAVIELEFDSLSKDAIKTSATFTGKGLEMALSLLSTRGYRLHGLTIVKFVFVLTDAMSTNIQATKGAAGRLRREATVVAIGIGREVLHSELQTSASPPDANSLSYVYSVENFDALNGLIGRLIDATCEKCGVSHMTDIFVIIDDVSESAMTQQEFSAALNGLTYIAHYLPAYGQVNGQTVNITTIGDLGYRHTSIHNATDLDSLLMSIQSIRQQQSLCYINECDKALAINISSGMIQIIPISDQNSDNRNNSRKILIVFSSGRFVDKALVKLELHDELGESNIDIFAIGPGYDTDMEGLHALVKEPYNVFSLLDNNLETFDVLKSKLLYVVCS